MMGVAEGIMDTMEILATPAAQSRLHEIMRKLIAIHTDMDRGGTELVPLSDEDMCLLRMCTYVAGAICSTEFNGAIISASMAQGVADEEDDE